MWGLGQTLPYLPAVLLNLVRTDVVLAMASIAPSCNVLGYSFSGDPQKVACSVPACLPAWCAPFHPLSLIIKCFLLPSSGLAPGRG